MWSLFLSPLVRSPCVALLRGSTFPGSQLQEKTTEVVRTIQERHMQTAFPEVLPEDVKGGEAAKAASQDIPTWIVPSQEPFVHSYIDEQFSKYVSEHETTESDDPLMRAKWARGFYYIHLKSFLDERSHRWPTCDMPCLRISPWTTWRRRYVEKCSI